MENGCSWHIDSLLLCDIGKARMVYYSFYKYGVTVSVFMHALHRIMRYIESICLRHC